jgi:hypothetical protein
MESMAKLLAIAELLPVSSVSPHRCTDVALLSMIGTEAIPKAEFLSWRP